MNLIRSRLTLAQLRQHLTDYHFCTAAGLADTGHLWCTFAELADLHEWHHDAGKLAAEHYHGRPIEEAT